MESNLFSGLDCICTVAVIGATLKAKKIPPKRQGPPLLRIPTHSRWHPSLVYPRPSRRNPEKRIRTRRNPEKRSPPRPKPEKNCQTRRNPETIRQPEHPYTKGIAHAPSHLQNGGRANTEQDPSLIHGGGFPEPRNEKGPSERPGPNCPRNRPHPPQRTPAVATLHRLQSRNQT